jgi:ribosomal protein S21
MLTLPVDLPPQMESAESIADARFALALGFICQGGGRITVAQAAQIAGMEERAFFEKASAISEEMEEMVQQAYDNEHCAAALEQMKRAGGKTSSLEEVRQRLGF